MPKKSTNSQPDFFANLKARAGNLQKMGETTSQEDTPSERLLLLSLDLIMPNPNQPRRLASPQEDEELTFDVRERGILQPILVRPAPKTPGKYQLVAGDRRTRAARSAGLTEIPAIIKDFDDREARLVAAVENLQRKDLDPLDEARYFQFLSDEYNLSHRNIAELIHKSPSYVDQRMRLLDSGRVNNTQKFENSQTPSVEKTSSPKGSEKPLLWKFKPKEWERFRQAVGLAKSSYRGIKPDEREIMRQTIHELRKELEALEKELGK